LRPPIPDNIRFALLLHCLCQTMPCRCLALVCCRSRRWRRQLYYASTVIHSFFFIFLITQHSLPGFLCLVCWTSFLSFSSIKLYDERTTLSFSFFLSFLLYLLSPSIHPPHVPISFVGLRLKLTCFIIPSDPNNLRPKVKKTCYSNSNHCHPPSPHCCFSLFQSFPYYVDQSKQASCTYCRLLFIFLLPPTYYSVSGINTCLITTPCIWSIEYINFCFPLRDPIIFWGGFRVEEATHETIRLCWSTFASTDGKYFSLNEVW